MTRLGNMTPNPPRPLHGRLYYAVRWVVRFVALMALAGVLLVLLGYFVAWAATLLIGAAVAVMIGSHGG